MQKDNWSQREIVRKWSKGQTKLGMELPINPKINSEIEVTLLPSQYGNWQLTWWSHRRRNEFSKQREMDLLDQWSPTAKSEVRGEASQPSPRSCYWTRLPGAQPWSRPHYHHSALQKRITESSTIYESISITDDYRLQDIFYRGCRSTAQSTDSASAPEFGK